MLEQAKKKSSSVEWNLFDVVKTSYESAFFDAVICSLAIHHFQDVGGAFKEISRVLCSSGTFVIFTSTPEQMNTYWLNYYFPEMMARSTAQMPSVGKIESALNIANLKLVEVKPFLVSTELKDLFLYGGKQRPEMYLSESVRAGISSFRNFSSDAELREGLSQLAADIESGNIGSIMDIYENNMGDYCFLIAKK
jgi:ubiquinone/menaquinone biosynthesis C-methylase UbiE